MLILGLQKTTLLDFPGKLASTVFTGGCNFRCPYCHNGDLVLQPGQQASYSVEEVMEHVESRSKVIDGVAITGGEPTLHADLYDFIKSIKDLGLLVKLDSNGTNPAMLKRLIDDKMVDYVAMDIKHSFAKYNQVACMKNLDMTAISESVDLLMASNMDYEFRTTVAKPLHTVDDMRDISKWIKGAKAYFLQNYKESEQVIDKVFSPYTNEELNEFVEAISPLVPSVKIRGVED